ncbi:beta-hexosaminidase [Thraustotheca clavata]|uniref:Beta-hexosaminidase n=1 Tax=Thraustotheca clavata TaxID=74557 RepID=A0A0A7CMR1_9STRA|nr:secreted protein [Thraustotheca clavata]OQR81875.1 beta-hexosaminidase [Thraustotheca clavata]
MKLSILLAAFGVVASSSIPKHTYKCNDGVCVQTPLNGAGVSLGSPLLSLRMCEMTCGAGSLWPYPASVSLGTTATAIDTNKVSHSIKINGAEATSTLTNSIVQTFNEGVKAKTKWVRGQSEIGAISHSIYGTISSNNEVLGQDTDESYELSIDGPRVKINAATIYGYRHALTTLNQLIDYDELTNSVKMISKATISDKPAYSHRGIVLDTSRNFYPIESLKRMIDTMGANKLNTFHWHMTDSSSFPIEINGEPRLTTYGAYSAEQIYTQDQIRDLVQFAKARGVRIIPELDAPAHAGAGWQWGPKAGYGDLTLCYGADPWMNYCLEPPCGQLNPLNKQVYSVLDTVYKELTSLFDGDVFHMGGDEVSIPCWNSSKVITDHLKDTNKPGAFFDLWGDFQTKAAAMLNKKVMVWSSDLTTDPYLKYFEPNNTIIQLWGGSTDGDATRITSQGYDVVASYWDAYYLDCGFGGWVSKGNGWCAPYKSWQVIYDLDITANMTAANAKHVLGSEVAMWSEIADAHVVETKVWPRAAALAERLWTNPKTDWKSAMGRMRIQRDRIADAGIGADAVHPLWCRQNPGKCQLV